MLGFVNLGSSVLVLDVDFVTVGVPVLLVEVHRCFNILGISIVGEAGIEVCGVGVEVHL